MKIKCYTCEECHKHTAELIHSSNGIHTFDCHACDHQWESESFPKMPKFTDDMLVEFAAKAAGYQYKGRVGNEYRVWDPICESYDPWNPLNDTRDAYELIHKLKLTLTFGEAWVECCQMDGNIIMNGYAAERRTREESCTYAIVGCAAFVGGIADPKL